MLYDTDATFSNFRGLIMYLPKFKTQIAFDEDKVKREGKYSVDKMYKIADDFMAKLKQRKVGRGEYVDTGLKDDYSAHGIFYLRYSKTAWFTDNVSVWNFWISDHRDPTKMYSENFLEHIRNVKKSA